MAIGTQIEEIREILKNICVLDGTQMERMLCNANDNGFFTNPRKKNLIKDNLTQDYFLQNDENCIFSIVFCIYLGSG